MNGESLFAFGVGWIIGAFVTTFVYPWIQRRMQP